MSHSLHEDMGLHEFKRMSAELADGRHAAVEVDADGHLRIIAVWDPKKGQETATYPQQKVMEATMGREPKLPEPQTQQESPKPKDKAQKMVDQAEQQSQTKAKRNEAQRRKEAQTLDEIYRRREQAQKAAEQEAATRAAQQAQASNDPNAMTVINTTDSSAAAQAMQVQNLKKMGLIGDGAAQNLMTMLGYGSGIGTGSAPDTKSVKHAASTHIPRDPVFLARLGNVMNDNQFDRRLRGRTRGKLDMTRLYKAETGSMSVFTQKSMRKNKRYNVALVLDQSGSMGTGTDPSSRLTIVAQSAQFLAQHLDKIPGVELMIVGFSSAKVVHKRFDEHIALDTIWDRVATWSYGGSGTNNNPALEVAYSALAKQEKGHNILLYLADGDSSDPEEFRKLVAKNTKATTTVGVAIQQGKKMAEIPLGMDISDLNDLKPALIGILQKEIKRG